MRSAPRRAPCSKPPACGCEPHNLGSSIVIVEVLPNGFVLPKCRPLEPRDLTQDLSGLLMLSEQKNSTIQHAKVAGLGLLATERRRPALRKHRRPCRARLGAARSLRTWGDAVAVIALS